MLYLLNPKAWIAIGLVVLLAVTNVWSYRHGKTVTLADWNAAKAAATENARQIEAKRQSGVDAALRDAASREARARADSASARRYADGLRGDLDALRLHAEKSLAAALDANRTLGIVVEQCAKELVEVASDADQARSEALTLRMAWPK